MEYCAAVKIIKAAFYVLIWKYHRNIKEKKLQYNMHDMLSFTKE